MNLEPYDQSLSLKNRYIIAVVKEQKIAFSSHLVSETLAIDKRKVLTLPMYDRSLFGIVHDRGNIVPLIAWDCNYQTTKVNSVTETLIAIRLSHLAGDLQGVGLLVDRAIGTLDREQVEAPESPIKIWKLQDISQQTWRAKR